MFGPYFVCYKGIRLNSILVNHTMSAVIASSRLNCSCFSDKSVYLLSPGVGDKLQLAHTDTMLAQTPPQTDSGMCRLSHFSLSQEQYHTSDGTLYVQFVKSSQKYYSIAWTTQYSVLMCTRSHISCIICQLTHNKILFKTKQKFILSATYSTVMWIVCFRCEGACPMVGVWRGRVDSRLQTQHLTLTCKLSGGWADVYSYWRAHYFVKTYYMYV